MAVTDIVKQPCWVYFKRKSGAWQKLGYTDSGNDLDIQGNVEVVLADETGKSPIGHTAGGESVKLTVSFKEYTAETLLATYPFAAVTGSGSTFGVRGIDREPGESLASCCISLKLDPIKTADTGGVFLPKCINISNIKSILKHDREKLLTCVFNAELDDTQASGEELYAIDSNAASNISGWS